MKLKRLLWLRLLSTIIDVSLIYCLSIFIIKIIWAFTYIDFGIIFIATFMLYYSVFYWKRYGQTPAKTLTGLKVLHKSSNNISLIQILFREFVFKGFLGIIFTSYILEHLIGIWASPLTVLALLVIFVLSIVFLLFFKKTWWELFSKSITIKGSKPDRQKLKYNFFFILLVLAMGSVVIIYPLFDNYSIKTFEPKYPVTKEVKVYADFVKNKTQNPVDYVFSLFEKYDMVVLSERLHPEYTQYELITKIISDKRFIDKIGNIYTECGSVSFQDSLSHFMNTVFASDDSLNMATAILQRNSNAIWPLWDNTNLFDLLKHVNKLNSKLADSLKINWYFADQPVNWETMTPQKRQDSKFDYGRDSIMADNIINKYKSVISKQKRKKALVIMNTRHGYGLLDHKFDGKLNRFMKNNTTAFLMKDMPGRIANVMINSISMLFMPIQNGKWETAFSFAGNPEVGFNFAGSPFGEDKFDAYVINSPSLKYKDVFTGFIFYKPLEEHFKKVGFPHEYDNFEDTLLRHASCVSESQVKFCKKDIAYHKLHHEETDFVEPYYYAVFYNGTITILGILILFISLLISLLLFFRQIKHITITQ